MQRSNKGFTLIELLVVIAIIGILSSVVLASVTQAQIEAREARALQEMSTIARQVWVFESHTEESLVGQNINCQDLLPNGSTEPPANEFLLSDSLLLANPSASGHSVASGWKGPYIDIAEVDLNDPWGNPYFVDDDYQCQADTKGCENADLTLGTFHRVLGSSGGETYVPNNYSTTDVVYILCFVSEN